MIGFNTSGKNKLTSNFIKYLISIRLFFYEFFMVIFNIILYIYILI